jgi:uncharacterized protein YbjT (DUF2867 family)
MKTAIIIGATGFTGSLVLEQLLANSDYEKIKLFSRSSSGIKQTKVEEYIVDLLKLENSKSDFTADEVYCCIGTTKKKTPDQEKYKAIDFGIPAATAKLCSENGIEVMAVVSAIGANPKSKIFYNRTKGEMEEAVKSAGIPRTYILRPSFIGGNRKEKRAGEKIALAIFNFLKPLFFGGLKKYAVIEASAIAKRMIQLANSKEDSKVLESNEI